jgi:hypothetical protein
MADIFAEEQAKEDDKYEKITKSETYSTSGINYYVKNNGKYEQKEKVTEVKKTTFPTEFKFYTSTRYWIAESNNCYVKKDELKADNEKKEKEEDEKKKKEEDEKKKKEEEAKQKEAEETKKREEENELLDAPYKILGLKKGATASDASKAYNKASFGPNTPDKKDAIKKARDILLQGGLSGDDALPNRKLPEKGTPERESYEKILAQIDKKIKGGKKTRNQKNLIRKSSSRVSRKTRRHKRTSR